MNTIIAKAGQSMSDLVIMAMGTLQGAADFCNLNGVALSDDPAVGTVFQVPTLTNDNSDPKVLAYLTYKNVEIGTNTPPPPLPPEITLHGYPSIEWTTGIPFDPTYWLSGSGTLMFYTSAFGGTPIAIPASFSEEGITTLDYWVSIFADGAESERIAIPITIFSQPIITYSGDLSAVGSLDLSLGADYSNTAQTGSSSILYYSEATHAYCPAVVTTTGDYRIVAFNAIGQPQQTDIIHIVII